MSASMSVRPRTSGTVVAGPLERDEPEDVAVDVEEQAGPLAHVEQELEVGLAGLDDAGL